MSIVQDVVKDESYRQRRVRHRHMHVICMICAFEIDISLYQYRTVRSDGWPKQKWIGRRVFWGNVRQEASNGR